MPHTVQHNVNVYTYGSLRLPIVWHLVTGREFSTIAATLADHIALKVKGESFPGLIQRAGIHTEGVVYLDVDPDTVAVLDEFESGIYERVPVTVATTDNRQISCEVYRVTESGRSALREEPWDFEEFRTRFLEDFIRNNIGGPS